MKADFKTSNYDIVVKHFSVVKEYCNEYE